jgi:hypothetical protein
LKIHKPSTTTDENGNSVSIITIPYGLDLQYKIQQQDQEINNLKQQVQDLKSLIAK